MSWYSNWAKRVQITPTYVFGDTFTDFVVLVHLSTSSGTNSKDVTCVFDELGSPSSYANRYKIAFVYEDQECYADIDQWDESSDEAWIWVRIPTIQISPSPEFYLYYDVSKSDNTSYIKDKVTGGQSSIWQSYCDFSDTFGMVYHLGGYLTDVADTLVDMCGNLTITAYNMGAANNVAGLFGDCLQFNGTDEYCEAYEDYYYYTMEMPFTIEAWINSENMADDCHIATLGDGSDGLCGIGLRKGLASIFFKESTGGPLYVASNEDSTLYTDGEWHHFAGVFEDNTNKRLYVDGNLVATLTDDVSTLSAGELYIAIGRSVQGSDYFDGLINDVRFVFAFTGS